MNFQPPPNFFVARNHQPSPRRVSQQCVQAAGHYLGPGPGYNTRVTRLILRQGHGAWKLEVYFSYLKRISTKIKSEKSSKKIFEKAWPGRKPNEKSENFEFEKILPWPKTWKRHLQNTLLYNLVTQSHADKGLISRECDNKKIKSQINVFHFLPPL